MRLFGLILGAILLIGLAATILSLAAFLSILTLI